MRSTLFILTLLFLGFQGWGQVALKDSSKRVYLFSPSYSFQIPGGDLDERFGYNSNIGMEIGIKTASNWEFSIEGTFLFGNQVLNENELLSWARNSDGNITTREGHYSIVSFYQRGWTSTFEGGKMFPVIGPNPNSGIYLKAGVGYIQHNIRVEFDDGEVPQLNDRYEPYYDRLVNGLLVTESVGFRYLGSQEFLNFFIGLEAMQGFTSTVREYNIDAGKKIDQNRLDLLYGVRVGWILPIHKQAPDEYYYY